MARSPHLSFRVPSLTSTFPGCRWKNIYGSTIENHKRRTINQRFLIHSSRILARTGSHEWEAYRGRLCLHVNSICNVIRDTKTVRRCRNCDNEIELRVCYDWHWNFQRILLSTWNRMIFIL